MAKQTPPRIRPGGAEIAGRSKITGQIVLKPYPMPGGIPIERIQEAVRKVIAQRKA